MAVAAVPVVPAAAVVATAAVVAPVVARVAAPRQAAGRLARLGRHDGRVLEVRGEVEVVEVLGESARGRDLGWRQIIMYNSWYNYEICWARHSVHFLSIFSLCCTKSGAKDGKKMFVCC